MVFKPQTFHDEKPQVKIENPAQATLEASVADALAIASSVDATQVTVTVTDGVVVLSGTVGLPTEVAAVAEIASRVSGVKTVRNDVQAPVTGSH